MTELQSILDQVANQASHRSNGCLTMRSERLLVAEIEQLQKVLHKLVHKGNDGRWYTSQHGDADVTYYVRQLGLATAKHPSLT